MFFSMRRGRAFVLLSIFLAAGTSLPSLDALVYHGQAAESQRWQSHLEPAGGCLNHTEHCGLGRTAPGSGAVGTTAGELRFASSHPPAPKLLVTQPGSGTHCAASPQPRAPPASPA